MLAQFIEILSDKEIFIAELGKLNPKNTFQLQSQLWDYVMQKGIEIDPSFSRDDIVAHLEPTSDYMYRVGCTFEESYCKAKICYFSNPNCSARKAKGVIYILREIILSLQSVEKKDC